MSYITGFHAMEELVRSTNSNELTILVANAGPRIKKILEAAKKTGCKVANVTKVELDRLAPDNRGAAILIDDNETKNEIDLDTWLNNDISENAMVIILDHIEDPHNFGAIIRSADIFYADLVIIPEKRAAKETDTVARSSSGAISYVPMCTVSNLANAVEKLKKAGFWCYTADMSGQTISEIDFSGKTAVIMGAESGVSRLLKERSDALISIPQNGHVDSLNVSVAAGIIMYEIRR